jgi:hypothetical protein
MAFSVGAQSELRPVVGVQWELRGAGPRPLRALPPASGARRGDAGRDLLRPDARASLSDPASPRQAGRSPNGSAGTGSTSSLKGGHPGETSVDVCAHGGIVVTEALVCARQRPPQFPLRPTAPRNLCRASTRRICISRGPARSRLRFRGSILTAMLAPQQSRGGSLRSHHIVFS